jgi:hypothetical protein
MPALLLRSEPHRALGLGTGNEMRSPGSATSLTKTSEILSTTLPVRPRGGLRKPSVIWYDVSREPREAIG